MRKKEHVLEWVSEVDASVIQGMHPHKLEPNYVRPSILDTFAKEAIVISERSACLWYEVGALIFNPETKKALASGYNGPARGDVDPRYAGCARVVHGFLHEGEGLCRGSHAELNCFTDFDPHAASSQGSHMIITLHPCMQCAKQIVNAGVISKVWYLWEYRKDAHVKAYLNSLGVEVEKYSSEHLRAYVKRNGYHPVGAERRSMK